MPASRKDKLLALYEQMLLIRRTEERLSELFAAGEIPGFIHLSIGQEAVAAGVMSALARGDSIGSTHRGHGHALAKGVALDDFFLEIMGKAEGICAGRGGSMHVADLSVGMLGANGIVGAGIPLAVGSALAHQVRASGGIAVACFGDGALAEGVLHESLNMAALWKLPRLLVCENNGWSECSPAERQFAAAPCDLASAFGIPAQQVDGNDALAVSEAAAGLREAIVSQGPHQGPHLLECITHRVRGHFEGDPQKYRDGSAERDAQDPLQVTHGQLRRARVAASQLDELAEAVHARVEAAVQRARAGTEPRFDAALREVYTETTHG